MGVYLLVIQRRRTKVTQRTAIAEDFALVPNTTYNDVPNSFLHKITTQPKFLPYTDMIQWVVELLNIADRKFITKYDTIINTFIGSDLSSMYHFPAP